jgi:superfamily II DNA or RNA helicase
VSFDFNETLQSTKPDKKAVQDKLVNKVVSRFRKGEFGGMLVAPCGVGKTVMGLKVAAELGVTATVLVHKEFLVEQWMSSAAEWLGLSDDDVGMIQQDKCDYDGKKLLVAMTQSLVSSREYDEGLYNHSGLLILDETHRHGAELWHKAASKFNCRWRLGLTATPYRKDGLWDVVRFSVGNIIAEADAGWLKPIVYKVRYSPHLYIPQYCWARRRPDGSYQIKKVYLAKLLNLLVADEQRNKIILDLIVKAVSKDRKVLLLTDRRSQIEYLESAVKIAADENCTVSPYVGGMGKRQRAVAERCQVILGTFAMAQEGLNIPDLDVLILATPHSDIVQSIGRVLRDVDGKKQPIVIDICDNEPYLLGRMADKRQYTYDKMGWETKII